MRRSNKLSAAALFLATALLFSSCAQKARINGTVAQAPQSELVAYLLNGGNLKLIDTLKTDAHGRFKVSVPIRKNDPEFVHIYKNGKMLAPVLLEAGDKVSLEMDTLGHFSVTGATQAELYCQAEKDYRTFKSAMDSLYRAGDGAACTKTYIDYYHSRVKFILTNSHSMAVVPVLCQTFGLDTPVFSQTTDAIHFRNMADSLSSVYPDSKYVKLIRKSAKDRTHLMNVNIALESASSIDFPEISLPDMEAVQTKLSEVDAKLVMLYFWSPSVPLQKMFNIDTLMPLYEKYNKKGFEIYSVALEPDKVAWATTVRSQMLPWVNVCDTAGPASRYASLYAVTQTPWVFFLHDGQFVPDKATDGPSIQKVLAKYLD